MQSGFTTPLATQPTHRIAAAQPLITAHASKLSAQLQTQTALSGTNGDAFLRRYARHHTFQQWLKQRGWTLSDFLRWFAKAPKAGERIH